VIRVLLTISLVLLAFGAIAYAVALVRTLRAAKARLESLEADLAALRAEAQRLAEEAVVLTTVISEKGIADEEDFADAHRRYAGGAARRGESKEEGEKDTLH
jgi:cell division protein FtsB